MPDETQPSIPTPPAIKIDKAQSRFMSAGICVFTPDDKDVTKLELATTAIKSNSNIETADLEFPGEADGVPSPVRQDITKRKQEYKFSTKEPGKVIACEGMVVYGKCRLYKKDPTDVAGTINAASEEFPATFKIDGEISDGDSKHTEVPIVITSLKPGIVKWYSKPALTAAP